MNVTGSFSATGQSASMLVMERVPFNVTLWGTFSATVRLERSFDNGATWHPFTAGTVQVYTWTAPASEMAEEPEGGVLYRLNCTARSSGTVNYRISQGGTRFQ